jgi:hypothetical protein
MNNYHIKFNTLTQIIYSPQTSIVPIPNHLNFNHRNGLIVVKLKDRCLLHHVLGLCLLITPTETARLLAPLLEESKLYTAFLLHWRCSKLYSLVPFDIGQGSIYFKYVLST